MVRRGGIERHFFGLKRLKPEEAFSTSVVLVPEVERLHQTFAAALRQAYGKFPIARFPLIRRVKPGKSRFTLVDPASNSVIFIKREAHSATGDGGRKSGEPAQSRLAKAVDTAAKLRDDKGDDAAAAKVLDVALARTDPATPADRARALAARAELAVALGDAQCARALRAELQQVPLSEEERLRHELDAADELKRSLMEAGGRDGDLRSGLA